MSMTVPDIEAVRNFDTDPQYPRLVDLLQIPDMTMHKALNAVKKTVKDSPESLTWTQAWRSELRKKLYKAMEPYVSYQKFECTERASVREIRQELKKSKWAALQLRRTPSTMPRTRFASPVSQHGTA
ncbi:hypothetical protein J1614_010796 [Plenodomus biglobosus]|nr:hypothetical protein J1614_010796 [Plenodomus biglobosus]